MERHCGIEIEIAAPASSASTREISIDFAVFTLGCHTEAHAPQPGTDDIALLPVANALPDYECDAHHWDAST
jgi:hypothetical protein